ncbi:MAG: carboxymuconolactone decarboxylase family protein [Gemmataceae bacterium]|nr:carboxymuconolactone decarboxylase family protein [Gemmataceae bacterium]
MPRATAGTSSTRRSSRPASASPATTGARSTSPRCSALRHVEPPSRATLAAPDRSLGLELTIRMALNNGATRQELVETLLHVAPYAGRPAC